MAQRILAATPGLEVLDVGCGTGISAQPFQEAGCRVLGVEVDARMADFARRSGLQVEVSCFEDWDPAGRRFDAVISGQAWHWVDPLAGASKAADVLRPGGRLAVFWNVQQPPPDLAEAFSAVYRRVIPDLPVYSRMRPEDGSRARSRRVGYAELRGKAADGMRALPAFGEPEQWRFDWEQPYTREQWLDQVPTFGGHSRFPPEKLAELLDGIGAAIDAVGGSFTVQYAAMVVTAARCAQE